MLDTILILGALLAGLAALGWLAARFGADSHDWPMSEEERLANLGFTWGASSTSARNSASAAHWSSAGLSAWPAEEQARLHRAELQHEARLARLAELARLATQTTRATRATVDAPAHQPPAATPASAPASASTSISASASAPAPASASRPPSPSPAKAATRRAGRPPEARLGWPSVPARPEAAGD